MANRGGTLRPLRVVLDDRVNSPDGIGRYTKVVGNLLSGSDDQLEIIHRGKTEASPYSLDDGREILAISTAGGADVIHLLDYRVPLEPTNLPLIATVHDILRVIEPDLCYSDDEFTARSGGRGLEALHRVVEELRQVTAGTRSTHGRDFASTHEEFIARMMRHCIDRAQLIVTPTHSVARQIANFYGRTDRVRVSHWGVDHFADTSAAPAQVPATRPYLLYVGQYRRHKGIAELINGFVRSRAHRDGLVDLVLVGAGLDSASDVATAALRREGGRSIRWLGAIRDDARLAELYRNARALLFLSTHEGFGFPPLEAMLHGCAVIASDIPVLHETLGELATFVDPTDSVKVAEGIDRAITSDSDVLRERRAIHAQSFQWKRHVVELGEVYREVLREPRVDFAQPPSA